MNWPFFRCKGEKCPRHIWLPYDPRHPDEFQARFTPINVACRVCKSVSAYEVNDLQWGERGAGPSSPLVMLYILVPCQDKLCPATRVNVVVRLWGDSPEYALLLEELNGEVFQWNFCGIACPSGHLLKLDNGPYKFDPNSDWEF